MSYQRMLETLDKAETGPVQDEAEFDHVQISTAVRDITKTAQKTIQEGKPFNECYDLESLQPAPEWQAMFGAACEDMSTQYGLSLS